MVALIDVPEVTSGVEEQHQGCRSLGGRDSDRVLEVKVHSSAVKCWPGGCALVFPKLARKKRISGSRLTGRAATSKPHWHIPQASAQSLR